MTDVEQAAWKTLSELRTNVEIGPNDIADKMFVIGFIKGSSWQMDKEIDRLKKQN